MRTDAQSRTIRALLALFLGAVIVVAARSRLGLPTGKPLYFGGNRSTLDDATRALSRAHRYLAKGGRWNDQLEDFVNRWLDFIAAEQEAVPSPGILAATSLESTSVTVDDVLGK